MGRCYIWYLMPLYIIDPRYNVAKNITWHYIQYAQKKNWVDCELSNFQVRDIPSGQGMVNTCWWYITKNNGDIFMGQRCVSNMGIVLVTISTINRTLKSLHALVKYTTTHFVTEMCTHDRTFCYKMMHCGVWAWSIVGFVQRVYHCWRLVRGALYFEEG